jgi:hypothetical protein
MNDEIMEENLCVQTKTSKNPENEKEKKMNIIFKKLYAQIKSWQPHRRLSLCWIFYCVNDNVEIDLEDTQIMRCIICY